MTTIKPVPLNALANPHRSPPRTITNPIVTATITTSTSETGRKTGRHYETILDRKWYYRLVSQRESFEDDGGCNHGVTEKPKTRGLIDDHPIQTLDGRLIACLVLPKSSLPSQRYQTITVDKEVRLYSVFQSYPEYHRYQQRFAPERRTFFEIILGEYPQKPHFDLDVKLDDLRQQQPEFTEEMVIAAGENAKDTLIEKIIEVFQEKGVALSLDHDVLVYTSHGSNKRSYHIVVTNYCHCNNQEAKALYTEVCKRIPPGINQWIDHAVYSPRQQFRILGCQKLASGRPKTFLKTWTFRDRTINHRYLEQPDDPDHESLIQLEESLVSQTSSCTILPLIDIPALRPVMAHSNQLEDDLDIEVARSAMDLAIDVSGIENSSSFPYRLTGVKGNLMILKRLRPSMCQICRRRHDHENPFMVVGAPNESGERPVFFHCRRAGGQGLHIGIIKDPNGHSTSSPTGVTGTAAPKSIEEAFTNYPSGQARSIMACHANILAKVNRLAAQPFRPRAPDPMTVKLSPQDTNRLISGALDTITWQNSPLRLK